MHWGTKFVACAAMLALAACSTTQVYSNAPAGVTPGTNTSGNVAILYSYPQRPYDVIGVVSAKRYKPGWTDPTVGDAIPQLRAAGAQLGADAVVVRGSRSNNDRHTIVEAEAIRYLETPDQRQAEQAIQQTIQPQSRELDPAKRCDSCAKIGRP